MRLGCVECLQSHCIHTQFHWFSGPPVCFPSWGTRVQSPGEYLWDTPVSLSRYIDDPNVIDHCGLICGGLHPEPLLGHRADSVIIPLDLTQLFCPLFHTRCRSSFWLHNRDSRRLGGSPVESLQSHCIHTVPLVQGSTWLLPFMRDPGSIPMGVLKWNRDSPVCLVSLHWWPRRDWSLWPRLRRALNWAVTRPLDLTQLFCPSFTLAAGPPSGFTYIIVGCWGGGGPCGEPEKNCYKML
jgi:hypothetical protein